MEQNPAIGQKSLPLKDSTCHFRFSLFLAFVIIAASVVGLVSGMTVYPTEELFSTYGPNDMINLVLGVPFLLVSVFLAWRKRLIGLLLWPGALFFNLYNYLLHLFALPPSGLFLLSISVAVLSLYALIWLLASIDAGEVYQRLTGVSAKFGGGVLAALGFLFFARVAYIYLASMNGDTIIPVTEDALLKTDFLIAPAWIVGGILLVRKHPFGYVIGLGLLAKASLLMFALIPYMALQNVIVGKPVAVMDFVVVLLMSLILIVPTILLIRTMSFLER